MKSTLALILLAAGFVAPSAAQAADPSQPELGGFSARALGPDGEPTPDTYFKLELDPGETFSGKILVISSASRRARLDVYPVDGLTGATSGAVYANREDPRTETASWITPRKTRLRLGAKEQKTIGFDVAVPQDATPGDHVGAVAMQLAGQKTQKGQFAITQINRVAIAVQIRVRGRADATLGLTSLGLRALPNTQMPSVVVGLDNTGQLLCRPKLAVQLEQGDRVLGTLTKQLDTILAGDAIPFPLGWPKPLTIGTYTATATVTGCGPEASMTREVKLEQNLRGTPADPGTVFDADESGRGVPWWAVAIAVVVALLGGFLLARRKPKREDDEPSG